MEMWDDDQSHYQSTSYLIIMLNKKGFPYMKWKCLLIANDWWVTNKLAVWSHRMIPFLWQKFSSNTAIRPFLWIPLSSKQCCKQLPLFASKQLPCLSLFCFSETVRWELQAVCSIHRLITTKLPLAFWALCKNSNLVSLHYLSAALLWSLRPNVRHIIAAGLQSKVEVKLQLVQSSEGAERGKLKYHQLSHVGLMGNNN